MMSVVRNRADELSAQTVAVSEANAEIARQMGVASAIHVEDFVFRFTLQQWGGDHERAVCNYFELGAYSAGLVREVVAEAARVAEITGQASRPRRLLDFASGYGCVARHLPGALPGTRITTCDIHPAAVVFNSEILGLTSHLSSTVPERLDVPAQDVILALSFFSHMPAITYARWLQALALALAPGGVLIFTANGYVTDVTGAAAAVTPGRNGFGFAPLSEQADLQGDNYGLTISYPRWVFYTLDQIAELRLARFQEGFWWARQDLYVCVRTPTSAAP